MSKFKVMQMEVQTAQRKEDKVEAAWAMISL